MRAAGELARRRAAGPGRSTGSTPWWTARTRPGRCRRRRSGPGAPLRDGQITAAAAHGVLGARRDVGQELGVEHGSQLGLEPARLVDLHDERAPAVAGRSSWPLASSTSRRRRRAAGRRRALAARRSRAGAPQLGEHPVPDLAVAAGRRAARADAPGRRPAAAGHRRPGAIIAACRPAPPSSGAAAPAPTRTRGPRSRSWCPLRRARILDLGCSSGALGAALEGAPAVREVVGHRARPGVCAATPAGGWTG